ncbi:MAG: hypothetical protein JJ975_07190 [Bacteroidia bacterium]|nr:hypothetical protein [Bacteroidia bacterium]
MSNERDIFDDLLKSQLNDLSGDVSLADWDAIEAKLDAQEPKRKIMWWFWLTGVLVLGVIASLFLIKSAPTESNDGLTQTQVTEIEDPQESVIKNKIIPTEAPRNAEANKSNQPEINSHVSTKLPRSNGDNNLPTKNEVDNEPGVQSSKGGENPGFTTASDRGNQDISNQEPNNNQSGKQSGGNETPTVQSIPFNPGWILDTGEPALALLKPVTAPNTDNDLKAGNVPDGSKVTRWEIGLSASPNWAAKIISPNGGDAWRTNDKYNDIVKNMENGGVSYRLEARVNRYFGKIFYSTVGFGYNQIEENVRYNYIVDKHVTEVESTKKLEYSELHPLLRDTVNYSGANTYRYFEVPLRVGIVKPVLNNRARLRVESGFKYIYLQSMEGQRTDVTSLRLMDLKDAQDLYSKNNLGFSVSAGLFFNLSDNLDLGFTPFYSMSLTSIREKNEGIKDRPYNTGLNINLHHSLWKK